MMRTFHIGLNVRGAIHNRDFNGFTKDDGTPANRDEALDFLLDHVAKGHRVIPLGDCHEFSFETGCPGHDQDEPAACCVYQEGTCS